MILNKKRVTRSNQPIELTRLNLRLLELLMRKSPQLVSREEIEQTLWPNEIPETNNLKVQLYQLRQKVDKNHNIKLIETVVGQGVRIQVASNA